MVVMHLLFGCVRVYHVDFVCDFNFQVNIETTNEMGLVLFTTRTAMCTKEILCMTYVMGAVSSDLPTG